MAHDVYLEGNRHIRKPGGARLTLIAALLGVVALFSLMDLSAPSGPQPDSTVSAVEDWHGNVRRSYGPNR